VYYRHVPGVWIGYPNDRALAIPLRDDLDGTGDGWGLPPVPVAADSGWAIAPIPTVSNGWGDAVVPLAPGNGQSNTHSLDDSNGDRATRPSSCDCASRGGTIWWAHAAGSNWGSIIAIACTISGIATLATFVAKRY
jgi:hypothetical protein